jgi:IS5 family transposase
LDRCPDHGLAEFKRYVGLAVLARNIQLIGKAIHVKKLQELEKAEKRKKPCRLTACG